MNEKILRGLSYSLPAYYLKEIQLADIIFTKKDTDEDFWKNYSRDFEIEFDLLTSIEFPTDFNKMKNIIDFTRTFLWNKFKIYDKNSFINYSSRWFSSDITENSSELLQIHKEKLLMGTQAGSKNSNYFNTFFEPLIYGISNFEDINYDAYDLSLHSLLCRFALFLDYISEEEAKEIFILLGERGKKNYSNYKDFSIMCFLGIYAFNNKQIQQSSWINLLNELLNKPAGLFYSLTNFANLWEEKK